MDGDTIPDKIGNPYRLDDEQSLRKKADENLLSTEQALSHKEKLLLAAFREHDEVSHFSPFTVMPVPYFNYNSSSL